VASEAGKAESTLRGRARRSPRPRCRARQSPPSEVGQGGAHGLGVERGGARGLGVGRGGARPQRSGEAELALRGRARRSPWPWGRARPAALV